MGISRDLLPLPPKCRLKRRGKTVTTCGFFFHFPFTFSLIKHDAHTGSARDRAGWSVKFRSAPGPKRTIRAHDTQYLSEYYVLYICSRRVFAHRQQTGRAVERFFPLFYYYHYYYCYFFFFLFCLIGVFCSSFTRARSRTSAVYIASFVLCPAHSRRRIIVRAARGRVSVPSRLLILCAANKTPRDVGTDDAASRNTEVFN